MKLDSQQKKIVTELTIKYDMTEKEVLELIELPFVFIRQEIKAIEFSGEENKDEFNSKIKNFNIPCVGKLYGNYYSFKYINDGRRKKDKLNKRTSN